MKILATFAIATLVFAAGCKRESVNAGTNAAMPRPGLNAWSLPAAPGSAQPDLTPAPDGRLLLSWLDTQPGRRTRLLYADYGASLQWQGPKVIAIGSSFVANWADTPHIAATPDGALWVQWLQKSAQGGGYGVMLSTSRDYGMRWSSPLQPHNDGTASEHGFVSLWAQGNDRIGIAWLDGRSSTQHETADADGTVLAGGATMLRAALYDGALVTEGDAQIDAVTCDCCQTSVALTSKGPLLAYRDRAAGDVRDISVTRFDGKAWSAPRSVHADGWRMTACPVNGPSIAATGANAIVGWYTAAGDTPSVRLARSADSGDTFAAPVTLDEGAAVQGRISVAMDTTNAWALWVREDASGQSLWLARYATDLAQQLEKVEVARLQGRGRGTGSPQLALRNGTAYIVWTDMANGQTALHGASYVAKDSARR